MYPTPEQTTPLPYSGQRGKPNASSGEWMPHNVTTSLAKTATGTWPMISRSLRQNWFLVLGTTGVFVAGTGLYLSQVTPQYQAVAVIRLASHSTTADRTNNERPTDQWHEPHMKAQLATLKGRRLAEHVVDELGLEQDRLVKPPVMLPDSLPAGLDVMSSTTETQGLVLKLDRQLRVSARRPDPYHLPPNEVIIARESAIRAFRASLTVVPVPRSDLVQIRVSDPNPSRAAQTANTLANGFLAMQQERSKHLPPPTAQTPQAVQAAPTDEPAWGTWPPAGPLHEQIQSRLDADMKRMLHVEQRTPITPWWLTPDVYASVPNPPVTSTTPSPSGVDDMAILQNPFVLWKLTAQRTDESPSLSNGSRTSAVAIVAQATVPRTPHTPQPHLPLGVAFVCGILAGSLLALRKGQAYAPETVTESSRTKSDLRSLGSVPLTTLPAWANSVPVAQLVHTDPQGPMAEAYRSIARTLLEASPSPTNKPLLVTGFDEDEGSTTTAIGVSIALSQLGQNVLLIDANLRKPNVHQTLNLRNDDGLSRQLGEEPATTLPIQTTAIDNLSVLSAGPRVSDPLRQLLGSRLTDVLDQVAQLGFHQVVIDSAPLRAHADTLVLANRVPQVLLVVRQKQSAEDNTTVAVHQLHDAGALCLGLVMTQVRPS